MRIRFLTAVWAVFSLLVPCLTSSVSADDAPLTVFAAASLTDLMEEIAEGFENQTGRSVRLSLASSSQLARQLDAGAPADVYLSANEKWMNHVIDVDRVTTGTQRAVFSNVLVLAAPKGTDLTVRFERDFDMASAFEGRLAVGNPEHVPVGLYAKEALESLGWWEALQPRIAAGANTRAALRFVEMGEVQLGIVYLSDALASKDVDVVGEFPPSLHRPIRYWAAPVANGDSEAGVRFLDFLMSPEGREAIKAHGFVILE